ncbi:MAG: hypothetical protein QOJ52_1684 [Acidimicrobiaceae bacterium]|nr:hypothetical protein [Acidimicrobiaceae bacterium]
MKVTNVNKAVRRSGTRIALASAFAMGVLGLVGAGVYAGLNATATGTQTVTSGTLSLVVTTEAGAGFGQTFSNMAPGDVHNSYVTLTNGATLAAQNLTLAVSPGTANELSSAAKGLTVTVTGCTVAWTLPAVCASPTVLMAATPVATLATTATAVGSGAIATSAVYHLQISITLPDQNETTINGVTPTTTVQGLSTTLNFTFNEVQRALVTTNT